MTTDSLAAEIRPGRTAHPSRRWTLLAVSLATFMTLLDNNIINVAIPTIQRDLHLTQSGIEWVVSAYILFFAGLLLAGGRLADVFGRKRLFAIGLTTFTLASLAAGLSGQVDVLIASRALQGVGAALVTPTTLAIITSAYPDPRERAAAVGAWSAVGALALAVGPLLGGVLSQDANWHWIFFINLPIGLLSFWLSSRLVEDPPYLKERVKQARNSPVDFTGLALVASGVGCLEFFLDKGQEKDWFGDPMIATVACVAACLLIIFVLWEWNHPDPIVDLRLLQNRNFGTAVFLQLILGMVLFGSTVLIPQYLQTLLGFTAERAGMVLSPGGFVLMIMMMVAGRLVGKFDPRVLVCIGYGLTAAGLYNLTRLSLDSSFGDVTLWRALQVIGLPLVFIPISTLNYVGVPPSKSNQISSLSNFARNLGGSAGTALLTTFLARTAQTHQTTLATHSGPGSIGYRSYIDSVSTTAQSHGMAASQSTPFAVGYAYQQMLRQVSMLSYKNAFALLAIVIACLMPLPFLMRLPAKRAKVDPEAMAH